MAVEETRTVTISDEQGPAYELQRQADEVRVQVKRLSLNPPAVKLADLTNAVAKLNSDD